MKEAASQRTFTHRICLWMSILILCALFFHRCLLAKRSWLQINCFAFSHCFAPTHTSCNLLCKVPYTASISFAHLLGTDSRLFNQNFFTAIMITFTNYIPSDDFSVIAFKKKKSFTALQPKPLNTAVLFFKIIKLENKTAFSSQKIRCPSPGIFILTVYLKYVSL